MLVRRYWLDELYTWSIVADPSWSHAFKALAAGFDDHPPTYYLLLRFYSALCGTSEVALRAFSLLLIVSGLWSLQLLLRKSWAWWVAVSVPMALWCHPIVLQMAFEARDYALWFAATLWLCLAFENAALRRSTGGYVLLAVVSVVAATAHYFALLTMLALTVCYWSKQGDTRALRASACGIAAWCCCVPLMLEQRSALSLPTWVPPPSLPFYKLYLAQLLPWPFVLLLVLGVVLLWGRIDSRGPWWREPLSVLALWPVFLLLFSATLLSVLVTRYALPFVASFAPLLARLARSLKRPMWAACLLGLFGWGGGALRAQVAEARKTDQQVELQLAALRGCAGEELIVVESPLTLQVLLHYAPADEAARMCLPDFDRHELIELPGPGWFWFFVRDLTLAYDSVYRGPRLISHRRLLRLPRLYMMAGYAGWYSRYPGYRIVRDNGGTVYELERVDRS